MNHGNKIILKTAGAICLAWLAVSVTHDWLTAERRFCAKLDAELWKLRQPGVQRVQLSAAARQQYTNMLASREPMSRWRAAADLARWRDKGSVGPLITAMRDDRGTRRTCVIAQALGEIGDTAAVPALLEVIHHPRNLDLRVCATHALADIGDIRAVEPLIAKAADRDLREDDRVSAILALGDIGFPEAIPELRRLAEQEPDERFRLIAARALCQIELLQTVKPVQNLADELLSPNGTISKQWILKELNKKWDDSAAAALNQYIARRKLPASDQVTTAALLLHHRALDSKTIERLTDSPVKTDQWIAQYARMYVERESADYNAVQFDLIHRGGGNLDFNENTIDE